MNDNVREWCRNECIRQHATTDGDFRNMERSWHYAFGLFRSGVPPLIVSEIRIMAEMVDPIANPRGRFRTGPAVFMNGGRACHAHLIESHLTWLVECLKDGMTPNEFYQDLMWIHPFKDGNGRVGALVYNILNGTILNPVVPPEYGG